MGNSPCCAESSDPPNVEPIITVPILPSTSELSDLAANLNAVCPDGLYFMTGSLDLTQDAEKVKLPQVADALKQHRETAVLIKGYAERPPASSPKVVGQGMALSTSNKRAYLIRDLLAEQHGCPNIMVCEGMGYVDEQGGRCVVEPCEESMALSKRKELEDQEQDPLGAAQQEINEALGSGIAFEPGFARLLPESDPIILRLAETMARYPMLGYQLVGYTGRPGHKLTPDQPACVNLSRKRGEVVIEKLRGMGLTTKMISTGRGHVDDKGARTEVIASLAEDVGLEEPGEASASLHLVGHGVMEVCFERHAQGAEDRVHYATFTSRPLGLHLRGTAPLTVAKVDAGKAAHKKGVMAGMVVRMINGQSLVSMDYETAHALFSKKAQGLPEG